MPSLSHAEPITCLETHILGEVYKESGMSSFSGAFDITVLFRFFARRPGRFGSVMTDERGGYLYFNGRGLGASLVLDPRLLPLEREFASQRRLLEVVWVTSQRPGSSLAMIRCWSRGRRAGWFDQWKIRTHLEERYRSALQGWLA